MCLTPRASLSGLSMTRDRDSADVVCSVEGNPAGTGEGYEARLDAGQGGRGVLHLKAGASAGLFYAWQSMVQVLNANRTEDGFSVPVFSIRDVPVLNGGASCWTYPATFSPWRRSSA